LKRRARPPDAPVIDEQRAGDVAPYSMDIRFNLKKE